MPQTPQAPRIRQVGPESAADVLAVVRAAFAARPVLDPPTEALTETPETIATLLARGGGLLAEVDGRPAGAVVLDPVDSALYLRRFGVDPGAQGRGVARALVRAGLRAAMDRRASRVVVLAREELPRTIEFWREMGFCETSSTPPYVELARPVPQRYDARSAEAMRQLGARLGRELVGGDVVVLSGELGAGKTTFTQGLGDGLGVRGPITSPTFVIARVHPSVAGSPGGPELVHVDAYRLGDSAELDDLDLDTDLDRAVTVVEWGTGLAEALSDSRLEIRIERTTGASSADSADSADGEDPRTLEIDPLGPRWLASPLASLMDSTFS